MRFGLFSFFFRKEIIHSSLGFTAMCSMFLALKHWNSKLTCRWETIARPHAPLWWLTAEDQRSRTREWLWVLSGLIDQRTVTRESLWLWTDLPTCLYSYVGSRRFAGYSFSFSVTITQTISILSAVYFTHFEHSKREIFCNWNCLNDNLLINTNNLIPNMGK